MMPPRQTVRARLGAWVDSARVQRIVIGLILLNAVTLGLETSPTVMSTAGGWLLALDAAIVAVFPVEVALRLFARGPRFFRSEERRWGEELVSQCRYRWWR